MRQRFSVHLRLRQTLRLDHSVSSVPYTTPLPLAALADISPVSQRVLKATSPARPVVPPSPPVPLAAYRPDPRAGSGASSHPDLAPQAPLHLWGCLLCATATGSSPLSRLVTAGLVRAAALRCEPRAQSALDATDGSFSPPCSLALAHILQGS